MARIACAVVILAVLIPVHADLLLPLEQWDGGAPLDKMQCGAGKILMERAGKPACVRHVSACVLAERGFAYGEDSIRLASPPIMPPVHKISELGGHDGVCRFQSGVLLDVPVRAKVGEWFNITATFVFSDDGHGQKYWDDQCYNRIVVRHPPNYSSMGDDLVPLKAFVHEGYRPPVVSYGKYVDIGYKQPPITFQVRIVDPKDAAFDDTEAHSSHYTSFDLAMLSDDVLYDYQEISLARAGPSLQVVAHTQINGDDVCFSGTAFPQDGDGSGLPADADGRYVWEDVSGESGMYDLPFQWYVDVALGGQYPELDLDGFTAEFGLDREFVDQFLKDNSKQTLALP